MPRIKQVQVDMELAVYVRLLKNSLDNAIKTDLIVPLATGGSDRGYLQAIGRTNAYQTLGYRLLEALREQERSQELAEFRSGNNDFQRMVRRNATTRVVETRMREFEAIREPLYSDIEEMLRDPMLITDKKFQGTVALMERVRLGSTEMHLHFSNAFIHAWDQIPMAVLEKVMRPGESAMRIRTSSEEEEMKRSRSMSKGMSR